MGGAPPQGDRHPHQWRPLPDRDPGQRAASLGPGAWPPRPRPPGVPARPAPPGRRDQRRAVHHGGRGPRAHGRGRGRRAQLGAPGA